MKTGLLSLAFVLGASLVAQGKGSNDPVLMTVGGKPVTLSEFEYLYHKNNAQQSTPQEIGEYLKLFIPYRQKVAAAEAAGIDKSPEFQKEFTTYRNDLSQPYLIDKAVEDSIYQAQYNRMKEEVDVSHIMIFFQSRDMTPERKEQLMDSLLNCINQGQPFDSLAMNYSQDRNSAMRGGRMGYIQANRWPRAFEDAAWETPAGGHTGVFQTPFGYHIVKVNNRRPARGQVLVEHILRLTNDKTPEQAAVEKHYIDSLYTLVSNGADFEAVATANSQDPGSASKGGKLPWFGTGQMVPEFEETAFSLSDGEISKPFATSYGYHIIKRLEGRGIEPFDKAKAEIQNAISRDERGQLPTQRRIAQLRKQYKAKINDKNLEGVVKEITAAGGVDSVMYDRLLTSNLIVAQVGKDKLPLSEVISEELPQGFSGEAADQVKQLRDAVDRHVSNVTVETKRDELMKTDANYRNLVNEYRDGMLMFEIQDRNVWTKAKNDSEGLEKYFKANKDKYRWDEPRFKSRVIFASSDSVLNLVNDFIAKNPTDDDKLADVLRKQFGKDVKVERVIAARGENPITDYLGFVGEKPAASNRWPAYEAYKGKVLEQPEEAADVRGTVITDYQDYLLEQWLNELSRLYPASVNEKVLKQAK